MIDKKPDPLGAVVVAAVREAHEMRAGGMDAETLARGLEMVLRERWPRRRDAAWAFVCRECSDYGWRVQECPGDARCGRHKQHSAHDFVVPCWCAKGQALVTKQTNETDELAAIGKTRKPTRFGKD